MSDLEPAALADAFRARFGRAPSHAVRAPGRVNLIGEHTDYNDGLVLPCAIDRETLVLAAARDDARVRVHSREMGDAELDLAALSARGDWSDYVAGPWYALAEHGRPARGADLAVASRVPAGSGLSSSAALGVGVAMALGAVHDLGLTPRAVAELAHRGESEFVGVGCGIMDQFASALGREGHALRIDCQDRSVTPVPLAAEVRLLIAGSGVARQLAREGYGERVAECRAAWVAARDAAIAAEDAHSLRALGEADLPGLEAALEPVLFRRVRHVVTENARVDAFAGALRAGDLARAGAVLRAGQASLRDDYAVSTPELDRLCALGDEHPGTWGSRLTGAGFGGCTLHLVRPEAADEVAAHLDAGFERAFGRRPEVLVARASDGAREVPI